MSDLADKLFGPLPKEYCALFYYLSVLGFVWLVVALALFISMAVSKRRDASFFISAFLAVRALLRYITRHDFTAFAWYRIVFGVIVLLTAYFGWVDWSV
jgi:hypothetical protein